MLAALADVDRPGYRALLVQRTMAGPVSLAERIREWLEPTDATWDSTARLWRFPSGASLTFGHERLLYLSGEYHAVLVDDLTNFSDAEYRRLFQVWRRRQGSTTAMRVRVATSPGGPGHDWVRERFAIDNPASVLPLGRRVITAQMSDNPYLDEVEYRKALSNLDPVRRAQLETGDWSIRQGGAIFQRQWFRIVDRAPAAGLRRVRFWDLAATAEPTRTDLLYDPDYTVGALLGLAHDGTVYVLDVIRRRLDSPDVKRLVRQTAELDGREVVIGMEQESGASGKAVIADYRALLRGWVFQPRQPFADEVTRAAPYASYAEGGGGRLVRAPWNAAFLQEHEQFPLGEHDDAVDACGWAFFLLTLMAAVCVVFLGHAALQRVGGRLLLLAVPVVGLAFAGVAIWILRKPSARSGFAAEATQALAAHLPPGTRPPRVLQARQTGDVWEVEWRLPSRIAGPALLKKTRDLEHELGAALQLRVERDRLRMRAGTAEIPDLVTYEDFYRHEEPGGELVVGIGESRWGPVWTDLVKLPHVLIGGTTNFGKSGGERSHNAGEKEI